MCINDGTSSTPIQGLKSRLSRALQERVELVEGWEKSSARVLVPTEEVVEMTAAVKKRRSERKFFPGYVLVEMELNDESTWHLVKETPRSDGFYRWQSRSTCANLS